MRFLVRRLLTPLVLLARAIAFVPDALAEDAARPIPHNQDAPPGPALSPTEAIAKMTVPAGFRVELVAAEPDLVNPVAMTFDERGRVWVTESLEYPRLEAGAGRDRIKILEDTNHDGRADKFTIFAEGLNIPSGIAVGHGGAWVANAPDILFLQDTDGDGRADRREVVVTGFGRDDTHELPNSLTWGPDGWLYGLNGVFNRSRIEHQGKTHVFTAALWRIHPRTRAFELFAEGTSNPWGIAWNPEGSAFLSACVIDHLWHLTETGYYHRQAGAYPPHTWKIESIVQHAHQKAAYCGIVYFDSEAYPPEYRDRLYMGNIHGACINVDSVERHGSTYRGQGHPDFLVANDAWFMPVVQKVGPDGSLCVLDWYDQYHCYQDARRDPEGIDRLKGRLYRIRYGETPRAGGFDLGAESDEQLVGRLKSPNVYYRETAQRILSERQSPAARPALEALVRDESVTRKSRLQALWTLISADRLSADFHLQLLDHADPSFRAWGVRAAGNLRAVESRIVERLRNMTRDPAADVRLQLAIASRKVDGLAPLPALVDVLEVSGDDPLIPQIVWRNLVPLLDDGGPAVAELFDRPERLPAGVALLAPRVIEFWLTDKEPNVEAVRQAMGRLLNNRENAVATAACLEVVAGQVENRTLSKERSAELRQHLQSQLHEVLNAAESPALVASAASLATLWQDKLGVEVARKLSADAGQPDEQRLQTLEALLAIADEQAFATSARLLAQPEVSNGFQRRLVFALGEANDERIIPLLLEAYAKLDPAVQPVAIEVLTERPERAKQLLAAIERRQISREALNVNQVRRLLRSSDPAMANAVRAVWGTLRTERNPQREQVIAEIRNLVAKTPGNPIVGVGVFQKACAQCHKIYDRGEDVGPDLTRNGRNSWDQLLSNVFDPSLVIGAAYQARIIITTDGRSFTGLLVEDSPERVALKVQGGKTEVIARSDIDEMEVTALSLMPEGIEKQLSPQELADLLAFLALDGPPDKPESRLLDGAPAWKQ